MESILFFNRGNLTIPIQMLLSQEKKTFSQLISEFLKSKLIFKHFETNEYPHRFFISEITDSESRVI